MERACEMANRLGVDTAFGALGSEQTALQVFDFLMLAALDMHGKISLDGVIGRNYNPSNDGFAFMLAGEVTRGVILCD